MRPRGCGPWGPIIVAMFLGMMCLVYQLVTPRQRPLKEVPARVPALTVGVGQTARLGHRGGGDQSVWLCLDEVFWNEMIAAQNPGAERAKAPRATLHRLAAAGKVKRYPIGTKVKVLSSSAVSHQVKVIEGKDEGDIGWIQFEHVMPP
jgi:hypothetical protein